MLIPFNKDDYEVVTTHETCPFHKKHPGESYAGCTCSGSYGLKRKPVPEVKTKPNMCMRKQEPAALAPATTLGAREQQYESFDKFFEIAEQHEEYWREMINLTNSTNPDSLPRVIASVFQTRFKTYRALAQPQVAEGKEEPQRSGWIKTAERPPTKEDADEHGEVIWRNNDGSVISEKWDTFPTTDYWMPIPRVPKGQQKDLGGTLMPSDIETSGIQATLRIIKEEVAEMFREDRKEPLERWSDFDRALRSDFCRFITMLCNRVEQRLSPDVQSTNAHGEKTKI